MLMTRFLALVAALCFSSVLQAQDAKEEKTDSKLTLARIFESGEFNARSFSVRWTEGGKAYLKLEASESGEGQDLVRYETANGKRSVLVDADHLIPAGKKEPLSIQSYAWAEDGSQMLIYTNSQRVWRTNTRGEYWIFDPTSLALKQLGSDPAPTMMFAELAPENDAVAYVRDKNLFVEDLLSGDITQLTERESDDIINGTFDWVYEEEFHLRKGYHWSPGGSQLAYWQLDTSGVKEFVMLDRTSALYPKEIRFKYPKAGEMNAAGRVGVVSREGGETTWLKIPGDPREHYIVSIDWIGDERLAIQQFNRLQNTLRIFIAKAATGKVELIATDRDKAWIMKKKLNWLSDERFVLLSERDGWLHPWLHVLPGGKKDASDSLEAGGHSSDEKKESKGPKRLSDGQIDVTDWLPGNYAMASPNNATESYLYKFDLLKHSAKRVTPKEQEGSHKYSIAPSGKHAIHSYSTRNKVPVTELITLPDHKTVRVFENNEALAEKWDSIAHTDTEYFKVKIGGDLEADGWCIKPPNFDPKKKYPLLVYVYGEPAGQTTKNSWGGKSTMWHHMLAQNGYVVMSFDNRGTPAPLGREWRKSVYKRVGVLSSLDQAEAVRDVLKKRPYLDSERVGIWGWSGGGSNTLNALFRYPDLYKAGISIAPVPNQRHYDTIYMERYMSLPSKNARGYKLGSPIHYAKNLKGDLLLIHGTADDNCHYAGTEKLIDELIRHRKPFEMFAYPGRSHSVSEKKGTTLHLYLKMTQFLFDKLPPNKGDVDLSVLEPKKKAKKKSAPKKGKKRAV